MTSAQKRTALNHYSAYKRSTTYSLNEAYGKYSSAKANAWEYCENLMEKHDGHGLKVISHNAHIFTAGFMFEQDGKEMFMYISPSSDIPVEVA